MDCPSLVVLPRLRGDDGASIEIPSRYRCSRPFGLDAIFLSHHRRPRTDYLSATPGKREVSLDRHERLNGFYIGQPSKGDAAMISILLEHHPKFKARQKPPMKRKVQVRDITVEHAKQLCKSPTHSLGSKAPFEIAADEHGTRIFDMFLEHLLIEGSPQSLNKVWAQTYFEKPRVSVLWRVMTNADHFHRKGLERWDMNEKVKSSSV
jgi:hypothetical protein